MSGIVKGTALYKSTIVHLINAHALTKHGLLTQYELLISGQYHNKARIFLLVDLREFFSDLGLGDEKNK